MTIHWCGTGLSSVPGLRRLILEDRPVTVWNLPVEQAQEAVGDITDDIRAMEPAAFEAAVAAGDIVVSMLPAHLHADIQHDPTTAHRHLYAGTAHLTGAPMNSNPHDTRVATRRSI